MPASHSHPLKIGFLIAPGVAMMDLIGAHAVFGLAPGAEIHFLWKTRETILASMNLSLAATTVFGDCPEDLDVLVLGAVPGEVIADAEVAAFVARAGRRARCLIGICGGVLLLGAAGLLEGRRATTNFHVLDALTALGAAEAVPGGEVVIDGPLYTAGPATGSFEAALLALAALRDADTARLVELTIENVPRAPFGTGSPALAGPALTQAALARWRPLFDGCRQAAAAMHARNGAVAPPHAP
ncbi:MAG: Isonitrile hydratase [Burkholderia gladioli]|nr:MAG: Isonitrile hydratase [Burkholderia gladioli]